MKRVKADSWAARLDVEEREELLVLYHDSQLSLEQACALASEWSGRDVSKGQFSNWYHSQRAAWMAVRAKVAAEKAARAAPNDLDEAASLAIRQARFAAAMEELSAPEIAALERNEIARQKLELQREQLQLDKAKFEEAKRKAAVLDKAQEVIAATGSLTAEGIREIERQMNLL